MEYRWLVYMAGDNDLGHRVAADVRDLEEAVHDGLSLAVHADVRGRVLDADLPTRLTSFLEQERNGAAHHVMCLRSHATGWPGAAFEETTRDTLDLPRLRASLHAARGDRAPLEILGIDACYMAQLEVAFELRGESLILVASEEEERPAGWSYANVFRSFTPGLSPIEAAKRIVRAYEPQTRAEPRATLSAIRMDAILELANAVDALGASLTPLIATSRFEAIKRARAGTHAFKLYHYIDLLHFAECVKRQLGHEVASAAGGVISAVRNAVIATVGGAATRNANGISVYLPDGPVRPDYRHLALARQAPRWAEFVEKYGANR